jgi:hypothetical protein
MDGTPSGPSPVCCSSTATQCSHSGAGEPGCHNLRRLLWPVVARPVGVCIQGGLLALDGNGVRAAGARQCYFSAPFPCGVVGSGAHGDCE